MKLIDSLEREGGHVALLFLLVVACLLLPESPLIAKCGDMALGAFFYAMKGNNTPPPPGHPAEDLKEPKTP